MKKYNFLYLKLATFIGFLMSSNFALANSVDTGGIPKTIFNKFVDILTELITYYIMFAGLIWVIFMLIHGFSMLGKSDNRSKEEAKEKFITTVKVGIFVIILPAIATFIIGIVGSQIKDDEVFNGDNLNKVIQDLGN